MKRKPPKEEGRAENAARLANNDRATSLYHQPGNVNRTSLQARWHAEGARILGLYRRTGNHAHLKAFQVHRAAMGARLRLLGGYP